MDKDNILVDLVELASYVALFVLAGTIVMTILVDLIFFRRFEYKALW